MPSFTFSPVAPDATYDIMIRKYNEGFSLLGKQVNKLNDSIIFIQSESNSSPVSINSLIASRLVETNAAKQLTSTTNLTNFIAGTVNQVIVTDDTDGTVTLSTPQDIGTVSSPTFTGLTLSGLTQGSVLFAGVGGLISQDNTNLFWDDTNNRLGIGANPTANPLDVNGAINISNTAEGFKIGNELMFYANSTTGNVIGGADSNPSLNGTNNASFGDRSLSSITTGSSNSGFGTQTLQDLTAGDRNASVGLQSQARNLTGNNNASLGIESLKSNTAGFRNTAVGYRALMNTTGGRNTSVGHQAGLAMLTGSSNLLLGDGAEVPSTSASFQMSIGNTIYGDLSGGFIGIGVTTPTKTLEILGDFDLTGTYTQAITNTANPFLVQNGANNVIKIQGNAGAGTDDVISIGNITTTLGIDFNTKSTGAINLIAGNLITLNTGTGDIDMTGTVSLDSLTASTDIQLDSSKEIISVTNTGTGDNVMSASPTISGTLILSNGTINLGDTGSNGMLFSNFSIDMSIDANNNSGEKFRWSKNATTPGAGTTLMILDESAVLKVEGLIGIDVTATAKLQIEAKSTHTDHAIKVQNDGSGIGILIDQNSNQKAFDIDNSGTADSITVRTGATIKFTVDSSGSPDLGSGIAYQQNGNAGIGGNGTVFTFGGGSSGDIASLTIAGGIITASTTVP